MDFLRFLTRRIIFGLLVLWLISVATFALFFIAPPDVARTLAGKGATPQQVEGIRHRLGLDQPLIVQYFHYINNLLHGNLGTSFYSGAPVSSMLKGDLPPTISLLIGGVILWLIAGIGFGVLGGLLLFVVFYQFSKVGILWFQPGYYPFTASPITWLGRMILPWITLATVQVAVYSRLTRGSLLDALGED